MDHDLHEEEDYDLTLHHNHINNNNCFPFHQLTSAVGIVLNPFSNCSDNYNGTNGTSGDEGELGDESEYVFGSVVIGIILGLIILTTILGKCPFIVIIILMQC